MSTKSFAWSERFTEIFAYRLFLPNPRQCKISRA
jgi:hypothetical protein